MGDKIDIITIIVILNLYMTTWNLLKKNDK